MLCLPGCHPAVWASSMAESQKIVSGGGIESGRPPFEGEYPLTSTSFSTRSHLWERHYGDHTPSECHHDRPIHLENEGVDGSFGPCVDRNDHIPRCSTPGEVRSQPPWIAVGLVRLFQAL